MTKRLVWADNILCRPEQLVDSDVGAREGNVSLGELPMVTCTFVGGAAESEMGVGSLCSEMRRDRPMAE